MEIWATVVPDEYHYSMKRAYSVEEVEKLKRSALVWAEHFNTKLDDPDDHIAINCTSWEDDRGWVVKISIYAKDMPAAWFTMAWY